MAEPTPVSTEVAEYEARMRLRAAFGYLGYGMRGTIPLTESIDAARAMLDAADRLLGRGEVA